MPAEWSPGRRDYSWRWLVILALMTATLCGLQLCGVRFDRASAYDLTAKLIACAALSPVLGRIGSRIAVARRAVAMSSDLLWSLIQLIVFIQVLLPVSYLAAHAGAGLPLADATLAQLDLTLFGFDWDHVSDWFEARHHIRAVLAAAYGTMQVQALALLVLGSMLRPGTRSGELIWLAMLTGILTTLISAALPALGRTGELGPHYRAVVEMIRHGRWHVFSYQDADGIVSFPSFHTAMALLFTYVAGRLHPVLLTVFVPLNLIMLLSVFPIGGHYLVDALGGAGVAALSIMIMQAAAAGRRLPLAVVVA